MVTGFCSRTTAALTPAQRKELAAIRSELARVHAPIRHDAIDDAEKKTSDAEQRLEAFLKDAALGDNDSHIASIRKMIASRRQAIEKARERELKKKGLSDGEHGTKRGTSKEKGSDKGTGFVSQVAPIFVKHCLGCHGKEAKGGLRLDTFASMEQRRKERTVAGHRGRRKQPAHGTADGPRGGAHAQRGRAAERNGVREDR